MKSKIIKGITLAMFLTLIIGFVAYRSGYFGGQKSSYAVSPNGSALHNQTDTIPKTDSLKKIQMIPSSKALILRDHSIQVKDSNNITVDSTLQINRLIHSSKSGIILKATDLKKLKLDSILTDSLNN